MAEKKKLWMERVGPLAFLAGLVVAILAGIVQMDESGTQMVTAFLLVIGIVVGVFNVTEAESKMFLIAGIALLLTFGGLLSAINVLLSNSYLSLTVISSILAKLQVMVAPAVGIVALKTFYNLACDV